MHSYPWLQRLLCVPAVRCRGALCGLQCPRIALLGCATTRRRARSFGVLRPALDRWTTCALAMIRGWTSSKTSITSGCECSSFCCLYMPLHVQHHAVFAAGGAAGNGSWPCTAVQSSAVNPVQWVQGRQMHCKPVGNGKRQGHHEQYHLLLTCTSHCCSACLCAG